MRLMRVLRHGRQAMACLATAAVVLGVLVSTATAGGSNKAHTAKAAKIVLNYSSYVGGKGKANPKLSPITIGWVNNQGGPPSLDFPMATAAFQAAVATVNNQLGGIHGHPLKFVTCFIASTSQQGQQCGEQFAADKALKEVIGGLVASGSDGIYPALGGKVPFVGSLAIIPADYTAKNGFFLFGSNTSAFGPYATYIHKFDKTAKSVAVIYETNPGADQVAEETVAGYTKVGLTSSVVPFAPGATSLVSTATLASSQDVLVPTVTDPPSCVNLAAAFQQIGLTKPVLSNPLCLALPPSAYPGGDYPHWTFGVAGVNLADTSNPEVKLYLKTSAKYGLSAANAGFSYSGIAWGQVLATAKVMNSLPLSKLTPANLDKAWRAFKGPVPLGSPTINCDGKLIPGQPSACSNEATFNTYEGNGAWKVTSPQWLGPPK
jgi:branched-chain amino acid transport system substrate-binding protein